MKNWKFLLLGLLMSSQWLCAQPQTTDTYCNSRFGFCVDYPATMTTIEGRATNGDGVELTNAAGDVVLHISGSHNAMDWTPEKIYTFTVEDFGIDVGAKEEVLTHDVTSTGFQAAIQAGSQYQLSGMWDNGPNYLLITMDGPMERKEDMEEIWKAIQVELKPVTDEN